MSPRKLATLITAATLLAVAAPASASEHFTFPSASGALIATTTTSFGNQQLADAPHADGLRTSLGGAVSVYGTGMNQVPLPAPTPYDQRFGRGSREADAYAFGFLTHALDSASYANYAADYYRLFAPNYAVTAWTNRVSGLVEAGYGGAVDSWTAGAYYLARVRGPRRDSAPDLSTMPKFRPHPELEQNPTFLHN